MSETSDYLKPLQCPKCGQKMVSRLNKKNQQRFWGCSQYPKCDGTRDTDGKSPNERFNERLNNKDD